MTIVAHGWVRVEREVRHVGEILGILNYEWVAPKNKINKAAMDITESAIAGIRNSFLKVCMMPVKRLSNKITVIGIRASKR